MTTNNDEDEDDDGRGGGHQWHQRAPAAKGQASVKFMLFGIDLIFGCFVPEIRIVQVKWASERAGGRAGGRSVGRTGQCCAYTTENTVY